MSNQDKTHVGSGAHPSPSNVTASLTGGAPNPPDGPVTRQPQEPTVMGPAGSGAVPAPPNRRTMVGVAANKGMGATALVGVGAPQRDPRPPSTLPGGTPAPGSASPFAPPA